ncbi:MAG: hypothetical protein KDD40_06000, partial [Bdellovibrionales bacterium]|nr:hypothetical protein [Bdellovibrionales bacterium]
QVITQYLVFIMKNFYENAKLTVQRACEPYGIVASQKAVSNYRRLWARDSIICGLMGWKVNDEQVTEALKQSLLHLAKHQGPHGEIPSNISFNSECEVENISFGTKVGRIDGLGWYIVGACHLLKLMPHLESQLMPAVRKALRLYESLEINRGGFVYTPQGGNWADDYNVEGYLLFDQLLRLWALRCYEQVTGENLDSCELTEAIQNNFFLEDKKLDCAKLPNLKAKYINKKPYWACGFKPGSYDIRFDFFAHILLSLLRINEEALMAVIADWQEMWIQQSIKLIPAFAPVISEESADFVTLKNMSGPEFKNRPHEYHNGGSWPMQNGWWGLVQCKNNKNYSEQILKEIVNSYYSNGQNFCEYYHAIDGSALGTTPCTWSAATPWALYTELYGKTREFLC